MEGFSGKRLIVMVAVAVAVMMSCGDVEAQVICNVPVSGLMACRPAVTPPRPSTPSQACCSALANADFKCFCGYRSSLPSLGINPNLVMQLPKKCKLSKSFNC